MALSQRAQEALDRLREAYGRDFTIKSGYRSPTENRAAGGASGSQHMHGNAFDISTKGWTDAERRGFDPHAAMPGHQGRQQKIIEVEKIVKVSAANEIEKAAVPDDPGPGLVVIRSELVAHLITPPGSSRSHSRRR